MTSASRLDWRQDREGHNLLVADLLVDLDDLEHLENVIHRTRIDATCRIDVCGRNVCRRANSVLNPDTMANLGIAIDPSVNNIGVAYVREQGKRPMWFEFNPEHQGATRGEWRAELQSRAFQTITRLKMMGLYDTNYGVIEYPNFQHSARGHIAAQKGYIMDLAFVAGVIVSAMPNTQWFLPTPSQWKGQQSKIAIGAKFTRWTGVRHESTSDHCYEAVMMLKWMFDVGLRGFHSPLAFPAKSNNG